MDSTDWKGTGWMSFVWVDGFHGKVRVWVNIVLAVVIE
jgi:hypothetical protein